MIRFLWILSIGFVADLLWKLVEYPWQRIDENDAPTADAIIVLSGGGIKGLCYLSVIKYFVNI